MDRQMGLRDHHYTTYPLRAEFVEDAFSDIGSCCQRCIFHVLLNLLQIIQCLECASVQLS
jgi:hypothetical protein